MAWVMDQSTVMEQSQWLMDYRVAHEMITTSPFMRWAINVVNWNELPDRDVSAFGTALGALGYFGRKEYGLNEVYERVIEAEFARDLIPF